MKLAPKKRGGAKAGTSIGTWIVLILFALLAIPSVGIAIWVAIDEKRSMDANEAFADGIIHDMRWQAKTGNTRGHYRPQIVFWTASGQRIDLDLYFTDHQDRAAVGSFVRMRYDAMAAGNATIVGAASGNRAAGKIVDYEYGGPETKYPVVEFRAPDGTVRRHVERTKPHNDLSKKDIPVEVAWLTPTQAILLTP